MPAYRFGNMIYAWLVDGKTEEAVGQMEDSLDSTDSVSHPFHAIANIRTIVPGARPTVVDNVIYDQRLTELPIEEQKRQEAASLGKAYRVPEWWRGEKANYKIAQSAMRTIPKDIGPLKK